MKGDGNGSSYQRYGQKILNRKGDSHRSNRIIKKKIKTMNGISDGGDGMIV